MDGAPARRALRAAGESDLGGATRRSSRQRRHSSARTPWSVTSALRWRTGLDVLRTPPRAATLDAPSHRMHARAAIGVIVRAAALEDDEIGALVRRADHQRGAHRRRPRSRRDAGRDRRRRLRSARATWSHRTSCTLRSSAQRRWDGVTTAAAWSSWPARVGVAAGVAGPPVPADHHVPLPEQQVWIETYRGWFRVDGLWPERARHPRGRRAGQVPDGSKTRAAGEAARRRRSSGPATASSA